VEDEPEAQCGKMAPSGGLKQSGENGPPAVDLLVFGGVFPYKYNGSVEELAQTGLPRKIGVQGKQRRQGTRKQSEF
jgi:hypothetical protein